MEEKIKLGKLYNSYVVVDIITINNITCIIVICVLKMP